MNCCIQASSQHLIQCWPGLYDATFRLQWADINNMFTICVSSANNVFDDSEALDQWISKNMATLLLIANCNNTKCNFFVYYLSRVYFTWFRASDCTSITFPIKLQKELVSLKRFDYILTVRHWSVSTTLSYTHIWYIVTRFGVTLVKVIWILWFYYKRKSSELFVGWSQENILIHYILNWNSWNVKT